MPAIASAHVGMTWLLLPYCGAKPRKSSEKKHFVWECQTLTGLGALATADMGEGRPLCAVGP